MWRSLKSLIELMDVSLPGSIACFAPQKQKSPRRESWAMDDRVSESGKATYSNPPAHVGDNTYRRWNGIGRGGASKSGRDETSNSGYAGVAGVSIAKRWLVDEATSTLSWFYSLTSGNFLQKTSDLC